MALEKSLGNSNQLKADLKINPKRKTTTLTAMIFSNTLRLDNFFFMS